MRMLLSLSFALTVIGALQAEENPFKTAKEGDWAEYKITALSMGSPLDTKMKWTVAGNDGMMVTVKATATATVGKMDVAVPGPEIKIDLSKPYNPAATAGLTEPNTTIEKGETGKEKIMVGQGIRLHLDEI